jgi:hypothetical protein
MVLTSVVETGYHSGRLNLLSVFSGVHIAHLCFLCSGSWTTVCIFVFPWGGGGGGGSYPNETSKECIQFLYESEDNDIRCIPAYSSDEINFNKEVRKFYSVL